VNERTGFRPHHVITHTVRTVRVLPRLLALLAIVGLIAGGWYYVHERRAVTVHPQPAASTSPAPVVTVTTSNVAYTKVTRDLPVTGSIVATDQLPIGAEVSGLKITKVNVDQGSKVQKGDVLARLDSSVLEAQLAAARGRYDEATATVQKAVQPNRPQEIQAQDATLQQTEANAKSERAALAQAQATAANDATNAARYRQLLSQGFATQQETQNAETTAEKSRAAVTAEEQRVSAAEETANAARARLNLLKAGGSQEDVAIAQAQAEQARASIQQLEAQIAQTVIRAPADGLIVKRDAHIGDITAPTRPLFTMVRNNELELDAQVPEADLTRVKVGNPVTVNTQAATVQGKVFQLAPTVDPQTRLGTLRIAVPAKGGIRTGMFAQATVHVGKTKALTVPTRALQGTESQRFLFVLQDSHAKRVDVQTGPVHGDTTVIESGVKPGEQVIVAGAGFLNDGDPVAVKP
jgi:HlyD family secretion protein